MYTKPETETISTEMANTICSASVGFSSEKGIGPALAPDRHKRTEVF